MFHVTILLFRIISEQVTKDIRCRSGDGRIELIRPADFQEHGAATKTHTFDEFNVSSFVVVFVYMSSFFFFVCLVVFNWESFSICRQCSNRG